MKLPLNLGLHPSIQNGITIPWKNKDNEKPTLMPQYGDSCKEINSRYNEGDQPWKEKVYVKKNHERKVGDPTWGR